MGSRPHQKPLAALPPSPGFTVQAGAGVDPALSTFLFTCFCVFQHFYSESNRCYNQKNIVLETRSAPWRGPQTERQAHSSSGVVSGRRAG